jgi:serine protease Do
MWRTATVLFALATAGTALGQPAGDESAREEAAFKAAVAEIAPSVVSIETVGGLESLGDVLVGTAPSSGLVVGSDGYIISSTYNFAHRPASIIVTLPGNRRFAAKLVARDETRKLVLLKIDVPEKLTVPSPVPESETAVGRWSIAVGRAFDPEKPNVSVGVISAVNRIWGKAFQTDAKISPANYGGPLVDVRGRVYGILVPLSPNEGEDVSGVEWYDSGIGFAVSLEHVLRMLPRLQKGEDLKAGVVGVRFQGANVYADAPKVAQVRANSPAYKAGLRKGDLVVEVEGKPVELQVQVMEQLQRRYAGEKIRFRVRRGDGSKDLEIDLVDKLDPYKRPFLGVLPERIAGHAAAAEPGVVVRYVYEKSPAEGKGLKVGDRIVAVRGAAVADRDALMLAVAESEPGKPISIEFTRDGKTEKLEIEPATDPESIPKSIPPSAAQAEAAKNAEKVPGNNEPAKEDAGKSDPAADGATEGEGAERGAALADPEAPRKLKIVEFDNDCDVYVPANYSDDRPHGLVVLLYRNGHTAVDKAVIKRWQAACREDGLILLVPKAAEDDGWTPPDLEFVKKVIDRTAEQYRIDARRVVAHGVETGGQFAARAVARLTDRIRGVAGVNSPSLCAATIEPDPAEPLSFYTASDPKFPGRRGLTINVEQLRERFLPVVTRDLKAGADYPIDEPFAELRRWIDSLDRI